MAAAAEYLSLERIVMLLFLWQGISPDGGICLLEQLLIYDGWVMVWNLNPLAFVTGAADLGSDLFHNFLSHNVSSDITLIFDNADNRCGLPYSV